MAFAVGADVARAYGVDLGVGVPQVVRQLDGVPIEDRLGCLVGRRFEVIVGLSGSVAAVCEASQELRFVMMGGRGRRKGIWKGKILLIKINYLLFIDKYICL